MFNSDNAQKNWAPVLDAPDAPKFKDNYRRAITAVLLENQKKALAARKPSQQAAKLHPQKRRADEQASNGRAKHEQDFSEPQDPSASSPDAADGNRRTKQ